MSDHEQRKRRIDRRHLIGSWVVLVLLCVLTLGKDLFTFALIGNQKPRTWDYNTVPLIPAETYNSTRPVEPGPAPAQVELPPVPPTAAPAAQNQPAQPPAPQEAPVVQPAPAPQVGPPPQTPGTAPQSAPAPAQPAQPAPAPAPAAPGVAQ